MKRSRPMPIWVSALLLAYGFLLLTSAGATTFEATAHISFYTDGQLDFTSPTQTINANTAGDGPEYQRASAFHFEGEQQGSADDSYLWVAVESTTVSDSRRAIALYLDNFQYQPSYDTVELTASTLWEDTIVNTTGTAKNYRFDFWVDVMPPSTTIEGLDAVHDIQVHLNGVLIWDYVAALPTLQDSGNSGQANVVLNLGVLAADEAFVLTYSSSSAVQWDLSFPVPYNNGYDNYTIDDPHYIDPGNEISVHPVPTPAALYLLFSAMGALGLVKKRRG